MSSEQGGRRVAPRQARMHPLPPCEPVPTCAPRPASRLQKENEVVLYGGEWYDSERDKTHVYSDL
jgi:hypothetical protein